MRTMQIYVKCDKCGAMQIEPVEIVMPASFQEVIRQARRMLVATGEWWIRYGTEERVAESERRIMEWAAAHPEEVEP